MPVYKFGDMVIDPQKYPWGYAPFASLWSAEFNGTLWLQAESIITQYPFSIEAWVKPSESGDFGICTISDPNSSTSYYKIRTAGSAAGMTARTGSTLLRLPGTSNILHAWNHVRGVFQADNDRELFVNSVSEATDETSINFDANASKVGIGTIRVASPTWFYKGRMCDVKIWAGNTLAAHWPMDEGEGNILYDVSGNNNNATAQAESITWVEDRP